MQHLRNLLREGRGRRVHGDRSRQALRHFARERRSGDDRRRHSGQTLGDDLMQKAAGGGIETLGRPGHARVRCDIGADALDQRAERMARRNDQQRLRAAHGCGQISAQIEFGRQFEIGQIARIATRGPHRRERGGIAAPQGRGHAVARKHCGKCGAPGAGAQNGNSRLRAHCRSNAARGLSTAREITRSPALRLGSGGAPVRRTAPRS